MRNTTLIVALLLTLAWSSPRAAAVADADLLDVYVSIRTYDITGLTAADRQNTLAVASNILRAAGLEVDWMECEGVFVRSAGDPCLAPLGPTDLAVRFVRLPPPPGRDGTLPLGYSLVDTRTRSGSLATMYVDRVAGLAVTCGIDLGRLLGRAVAHEIGHLLLGTRDHANTGLMRALWSREAIRGSADGKWLFSPREARGMRDAVRTRTVQQLAIRN